MPTRSIQSYSILVTRIPISKFRVNGRSTSGGKGNANRWMSDPGSGSRCLVFWKKSGVQHSQMESSKWRTAPSDPDGFSSLSKAIGEYWVSLQGRGSRPDYTALC